MNRDTPPQRVGLILAAAVLLAVLSVLARPASALDQDQPSAKSKKVLLLLSGDYCMPWYAIFAKAVEQTILEASEGEDITLYSEFTGFDSNSSPDYLRGFRDMLEKKFAGHKMNLVVATAESTVHFMLTYGEELFGNIPTIILAETKYIENLKLKPNITGLMGTVKFKENIDLALRFHPSTKHVAVVSGSSEFDRYYEAGAREVFKEYEKDVDFIYLTGLRKDELLAKLPLLPKDTIVFYILMNTDGAGIRMVPKRVAAQIVETFDGPVYGLWDTILGTGIVGGYLSSAEMAGQGVAKICMRVLHGEKVEDIPITKGYFAHIFDWRQLEKWDIPQSALPEGSILRYEQKTLWGVYKWPIIFIALAFVLAGLTYVRIRTHFYRKQLKQQKKIQKMLKEQVDERTAGLQKANAELARISNLDGLTSLYNRRYFDSSLAHEWKRHSRERLPLSLIMCDIDYFKLYNDTYGHQAGDDCLKLVAQAMRENSKRPSDIAARYGGEEFVLVLTNTSLSGARVVAESIKSAVEELAIPHAASSVKPVVALSFGVATVVPNQDDAPGTLIHMADRALYRAKEQGRDRIESFETESLN